MPTKIAIQNLNDRRGVTAIGRTERVPGTTARVALHVTPDGFTELNRRAQPVYGNSDEIQRLKDLDSPGVAYLEWESSTPEKQSDRVKVALRADEMWDEVLQKMPDGTVVMNEPRDALQGDCARADVYSRAGSSALTI